MTGAERLRRIFARAGLQPAVQDGDTASGTVVLARADWVVDENLIKALAARPGAVLTDGEGRPAAAHVLAAEAVAAATLLEQGAAPPGLERLNALDLAYNSALRKREPPVIQPLDAANVRAVEARLFQGSYKGVTDLVTKHVWPVPARIVTRWCALAGMTPNQVTLIGLALTIAAFWLFWTGHFGGGLACAWVMTFLDTVDGKLARVTLTSSKIGNVLDHGIDLIHPPFWWWAWLVGVQATTSHPLAQPDLILWVVAGGYVAQRLEEGVFLKLFGGLEMHAWRPFDSWFRLITARRNPNLILLTAACLAGRPDLGLLAVAAWTAICLVVHLVQILQALATPRERVVSWLAR
ncbi:MAG: hypothetical protein JWO33_2702 [Caulobacteraceae bacterium]|nr:hypothetical protein [Caulobacteraceae bacterium]